MPTLEDLRRHGARLLDPLDAPLLPGQRIRPTAYVANQLLVAPAANATAAWAALGRAAAALHLEVSPAEPPSTGGAKLITIAPRAGAAAQPDAWAVLQAARAADPRAVDGVGLNHLLSVTLGSVIGQHEPNGGATTNAFYDGSATAEYGQSGRGGRAPVAYLGPPPRREPTLGPRRPVVAILDMGCGEHEWLPPAGGPVDRTPALDGTRIGLAGSGMEAPFAGGALDGRLHWAYGHSTFICGLLRQICPDADVISAKIVPDDGLVDEWALATALEAIHELARRHVEGKPGGRAVDVLSLSLGYYHEQLTDPLAGEAIRAALEALGKVGVVVVASAGNDATRRELLPAALSAAPPKQGAAPLISVGALNPDRSVALFSNAGDWVRHWAPGVALISAMPRIDGGVNASAEADDPSGQRRRSFDPDSYRGFATWSGTSFAAPVLAAQLAQSLICGSTKPGGTSLNDLGAGAAVRRGEAAVSDCVL
jgi:hypothetical protein